MVTNGHKRKTKKDAKEKDAKRKKGVNGLFTKVDINAKGRIMRLVYIMPV